MADTGSTAGKVLVTGFTGRLGGLVAQYLQDQGTEPRVLVRPHHMQASGWHAPADMQIATGDFDDPGSLDAALDGIDAIFLVSPVHPNMHAREMALVRRAAAIGSKPHIVKISGLGTRLDSFVDSGRWHAEIERDITASGLPATFLRPLFFMQNLGFQADSLRQDGVLRGAVADAAIAMVDARDIAAVAAAVLQGGTAVESQAVTLTGAHAVTYEEVARLAGEAFGRTVVYERQDMRDVRRVLEKSSQPGWHVEILLQFNEAFRRGWGDIVTDVVERVLGRPPRTLEAYLEALARGATTGGADPFPS